MPRYKLFRRPMGANLLLAAGSFGIALLAGEALLRVALPQVFNVHPQGMYSADSAVGYILTPGFTGSLARPEFHHPVTISQQGLRGGELRPRGANSFRIVCLGDSFTWGFGVTEAETFAARLEVALASRFPRRDIQVLNAGVPGYGTADQLHFLQSRATTLDPDLVIVQFLPDNDFIENRAPAQGNIEVRDGWLVTKPGTLDPFSLQPRWLRAHKWLKRHSHVASFLGERAGYIAMRMGLLENFAATRGEDFTEDDARITANLLHKVAATANDLGAESVFLFSPGQTLVVSETSNPARTSAVVERAAREAGADFIDLTPLFRSRRDRFALYYPVDGHWTAAGHAAVAEILGDYIASRSFLDTQRPAS